MENKENFIKREIVTKENLPSVLTEIAIEREKKGTSEILIPRIHSVREQAEKLGEKTSVLQLFQEEFLSAQHMIMEEKTKKLKANPFRLAKGILIMEKTAKNMEQYLDKNSKQVDSTVKNRVFRFLGRLADQKGQCGKSEDYYKKGLSYFDSLTKPEERFNRLEFMGFLSYSLIKQGKNKEGIDLTNQTLNDFDQSPEGKWLKENNYYTWAVWKSGIEIRTAEHFSKSKNIEYKELTKNFLKNAEEILRMPNGNTEEFRLRRDELNTIKNRV